MYAIRFICRKDERDQAKQSNSKDDCVGCQEVLHRKSVCDKNIAIVQGAKTKETSSSCGLRTSSSHCDAENFVAQEAKSNHCCLSGLEDYNYSRFEEFNQTLVEYLTEKLHRSPFERKTISRSRKSGAKALSSLLSKCKKNSTENFLLGTSTARLNNIALHKTQNPITKHSSDESSGEDDNSEAAKTCKRLQVSTINSKTSDQQRPRVKHKAYALGQSKAEKSHTSVSSRRQLHSDSFSSLEYELPNATSEQRKHFLELHVPAKYVIGRHFHKLFRNLKSRKNPIKLKLSAGTDYTYSQRYRRPATTESVFSKTRSDSGYWAKPAAHGSRRHFGRLQKNHRKYSSADFSARQLAGTKSKLNRKRSRHSYTNVNSETSEGDISLSQVRDKDKQSLSSSMSSSKPLRTVLKKHVREKSRPSSQRSVRFDFYPRIQKSALRNESKPTHKLKPEKWEEGQYESRHRVKGSSASQKPTRNPSKLDSLARSVSPHVPGQTSFENWQPSSSYVRLKSDEDSVRNDRRSAHQRRTTARKSTSSKQSDVSSWTRKYRKVPIRSTYTRLRNQGESHPNLMTISKK